MSSQRMYAQAGGRLMEISLNITIPDDVAADIQNGSSAPLSRRLLELAAIKAYEANLITEWGVIDMLGLEDREELYALFKRYDVRDRDYTLEEFEKGQAALDALLNKK
jgi:hypothetical protein